MVGWLVVNELENFKTKTEKKYFRETRALKLLFRVKGVAVCMHSYIHIQRPQRKALVAGFSCVMTFDKQIYTQNWNSTQDIPSLPTVGFSSSNTRLFKYDRDKL
jgi:hypothetical protein